MSTQGHKVTKLPDDVSKVVEKARNRVSVLEAEHIRLNSLVEALKVEANTLESQIEGFKDDIGEKEAFLSGLDAQTQANELAEAAATEGKLLAETEFGALRTEMDVMKAEKAELKKELDKLNKGIGESQVKHCDLCDKVEKKKANVKAFNDAVKSLAKELL
jgi:chromosome segregation ATPase